MFKLNTLYRIWISLCLAATLAGAVNWTGGSARAAADLPPGQGPGDSSPQTASPVDVLPDGSPASGEPGIAAAADGQDAALSLQGGGAHYPGAHFLHGSTAGNISGKVTYLDHPLLNQQSQVLFIATQNDRPNGLPYGKDYQPLGAYWNTGQGSWAVMYENLTMPADRAFNIYVPYGGWIFAHTATAGNTNMDLTLIDNAHLNGHPEAYVFAMHNYSLSAGGAGAYHNHNIGMYYDTQAGKWGVFNQDQAGMPSGMVFNIAVAGPGDNVFTHIASAGNIVSNYTILDDPDLNGNPNALLTVTPVYISTYFNSAYTVLYATSLQKWVIMAEGTSFPAGAAFHVLITPPASGAFVHIVSTQNIHPSYSNATALDHPYLNGNPDALVYVSHVLNSIENNSHWIYQSHPMGVYFLADSFHTEGRWYIYTTDATPLAEWQAFNVYYTSPQSNAVSVENASSGATTVTLSHPLLNGDSGVAAQLTHNWNPDYHDPLVGYSFPYTVGFRFSAGSWLISRPSGPNLPQHLSYNLLIPQANSFTHIASAGNIVLPAVTSIDNALTNGNRWAMVFVTPNGSPGGVNKSVNEIPIGVYYYNNHWAVFNESATNMAVDTAYNIFVVQRYPIFMPLVRR